MKLRYRELTDNMKAMYGITEDAGDETWLYCDSCHRAVRQGDCFLEEEGGESLLRCAYEDCRLEGNLAFQSLYGWDAYRQDIGRETAHWPEEPEPGKRYERRGGSPQS